MKEKSIEEQIEAAEHGIKFYLRLQNSEDSKGVRTQIRLYNEAYFKLTGQNYQEIL